MAVTNTIAVVAAPVATMYGAYAPSESPIEFKISELLAFTDTNVSEKAEAFLPRTSMPVAVTKFLVSLSIEALKDHVKDSPGLRLD